jgi:hypothetical protein
MIEYFGLFATVPTFASQRIAVRSDSVMIVIRLQGRRRAGDVHSRADLSAGSRSLSMLSAQRFRWTNAAVLATVRWANAAVGASRPSDRRITKGPDAAVLMAMRESLTFCGRTFGAAELELMRQIAREFSALGVTEIARTVCELLEWRRPSGKLKNHECRQMLERLQAEEFLKLPALRKLGGRGPRRPDLSGPCAGPTAVAGTVSEYTPLELVLVEGETESRRWREKVERYHYLGCRVPFGANLRYWVRSRDRELACLLWNSPAWKMQARDACIGWSEAQRQYNLQQIVNNGRFLILPGVSVKGLASKILALSARQVPGDWEKHYRCRPVLLETLVDAARFGGTCYRAANWIPVGQTTGRGRMDREHRGHGQAVKDIYVYPLVHDAQQRLCSDPRPRAELVDAHSLFASLVWQQVRPRDRSASDARHRIGFTRGLKAGPGMVGAPDVGSSCTQGAARPAAIMDAALPDPFPASLETLFSKLVRRQLHSLAVREGS